MTAIFGTMTVHAAVIEWPDDSVDPTLLIDADLDKLRARVRAFIVEWVVNVDPGRYPEELVDYVGGDLPEWDEFYAHIHEYDQTPWVTFDSDVIEIQ